jgi:hypothetical protein
VAGSAADRFPPFLAALSSTEQEGFLFGTTTRQVIDNVEDAHDLGTQEGKTQLGAAPELFIYYIVF